MKEKEKERFGNIFLVSFIKPCINIFLYISDACVY